MSESDDDDDAENYHFSHTTWVYNGPLGHMTLFLDWGGTMLVFQENGAELDGRWEVKDDQLFLYIPGASGPHIADAKIAHWPDYKGICPPEFQPATWTWVCVC